MNQYLLLRRLRGPVILVTIGVMALLEQYNVLGFGQSWPLLLIVIGIMQLAERAALAQMEPPPGSAGVPYPGAPYPGAPYPGAGFPGATSGAVPPSDAGQPGWQETSTAGSQGAEETPEGRKY